MIRSDLSQASLYYFKFDLFMLNIGVEHTLNVGFVMNKHYVKNIER